MRQQRAQGEIIEVVTKLRAKPGPVPTKPIIEPVSDEPGGRVTSLTPVTFWL